MDIFQNIKISSPNIFLRIASCLFLLVCLPYSQSVSAGSLAFSTNSYSVAENVAAVTITVNRTGSTSAAAAVTVETENGTAGAQDFTAKTQALTWGIGDSAAKTFTVSLKDDAIVEGNESFTLKFTGATGDGAGGDASVEITDYEEGRFQFSGSTFLGQEDTLKVVAIINRVAGTDGPATVKVKSSVAGVLAPASSADYAAVDATVSFTNGESTKNVDLILKNDDVAEFSEFFTLTLSDPTNATLGVTISATAEIADTDVDFTSTLKLLTKANKNIDQPQLVDLAQNSLLDSTKKMLDLVNTIPILTLTEIEAEQDTDGLLSIDVETNRAYLRPVAIKRAAAGATPEINVRDDVNSTFITSQGWFLEATPALAAKGLSVFQKALAAVFLPDLVIEDSGNMTIQTDQGAPPFERDALNNIIVNYRFYDRWNLRPSMISTVSNSTTEGYSLIPHPADSEEVVLAVVYTDDAKKRQQILSSAPINGPELIEELKKNGVSRCAMNPGVGCTVSVINPKQLSYGIITFDVVVTLAGGKTQTVQVKLFSDYKIRKTPDFVSSMVGFTEVNDINKDSFADYKMIYANGEEQYFFMVSSFVK